MGSKTQVKVSMDWLNLCWHCYNKAVVNPVGYVKALSQNEVGVKLSPQLLNISTLLIRSLIHDPKFLMLG